MQECVSKDHKAKHANRISANQGSELTIYPTNVRASLTLLDIFNRESRDGLSAVREFSVKGKRCFLRDPVIAVSVSSLSTCQLRTGGGRNRVT